MKRPRWRDLSVWRRTAVIIVAVVGGLYIITFGLLLLVSVAKF